MDSLSLLQEVGECLLSITPKARGLLEGHFKYLPHCQISLCYSSLEPLEGMAFSRSFLCQVIVG